MSKIKNDGLDQYGAEPFEQQQSGTAGTEGVNPLQNTVNVTSTFSIFLHVEDQRSSGTGAVLPEAFAFFPSHLL